MHSITRRVSVALSAAVLATTATGTATAQNSIPGDTHPGTVVRVDPSRAEVRVNDAGADAAQISGTFRNLTGASLSCRGVSGADSSSGTVAPAQVVLAGHEYYKTFPAKPAPSGGVSVLGSIDIGIDLADVEMLLPGGSVAPMFGAAFAARSKITTDFADAKMMGHTGNVSWFNVNNGSTHTWSAALGPAGTAAREDFQAGVIFVCNGGGTTYAFAGYEGTPPTPDPRGILHSGSLGRI